MMRRDLLKQWLARSELTLGELAKKLGITPRTLYTRMKKGDFRQSEIESMIRLTHMSNPCEVFFNLRLSGGEKEGRNDSQ